MKSKTKQKEKRRKKIHKRVRTSIRGTAEKPRFNVFKSNKHIYGQLIDDRQGTTLVSASTQSSELQDELEDKSGVEKAFEVGKHLGKLAADQDIDSVVFDRSGYKYHGQVKAIADGAREGGLDF
jgi:large subunit ribosomal protein L18